MEGGNREASRLEASSLVPSEEEREGWVEEASYENS